MYNWECDAIKIANTVNIGKKPQTARRIHTVERLEKLLPLPRWISVPSPALHYQKAFVLLK